jgi:hypothetical protein
MSLQNEPLTGPFAEPPARPTGGGTLSKVRTFDYLPDLSPEQISTLSGISDDIQGHSHNIVKEIYALGNQLIAAREIVPHGKWGAYLDREFKWSESTARNWINVAENIDSATVADLDVAPAVLYAIAAPATNPDTRQALLARLKQGEPVTVEDVRTARTPQPHTHSFVSEDFGSFTVAVVPSNDKFQATISWREFSLESDWLPSHRSAVNDVLGRYRNLNALVYELPEDVFLDFETIRAKADDLPVAQIEFLRAVATGDEEVIKNAATRTALINRGLLDNAALGTDVWQQLELTPLGDAVIKYIACATMPDYYRFSEDVRTKDEPFPVGTYVTIRNAEKFGVHRIGIVRDLSIDDEKLYIVEAWDTCSSNHEFETLSGDRLKIADDWDYELIWLYSTRKSKEELLLIGWKDHYISFNWNNDINRYRYNFSYPNPRFPDDKGLAVRLSPQYVEYFTSKGGTVQIFDDIAILDERMQAIVNKAGRARGGEMLYPPENEINETDLPDEPLTDLIFAAIDDGATTLTEILRAVKKLRGSMLPIPDFNVTLSGMVDAGDLTRSNEPGQRVIYAINGHTETSGQRTDTLDDDREAILTVLDDRPRHLFYKAQLSRWSGINDLARTTKALLFLTDMLRSDTDEQGKECFRRVNPLSQPVFVDASLPTPDEIAAQVNDAGGALHINDLTEVHALTPAQLGDVVSIIKADPRLALGSRFVYTEQHPSFATAHLGHLPEGTPPVQVPGQEALNADIAALREEQAKPALISLGELLGNIEAAIATVRAADLDDLRLCSQSQQQALTRRLDQHLRQLDAWRDFASSMSTPAQVVIDPASGQSVTFADTLDDADREHQSAIGDAAALQAAQEAAAAVPVSPLPARRSLSEHTS